MAPRSLGYKQVQQRMRRSLKYGTRRMRSLSLPLSELLVNYFDKYAPYDYMDMDFATSLARESCVDACTFLVAMVYVDRVRNVDKLYFETSDPEEMYLSALVVATKYLHVVMEDYFKDGGLEEFVYNDEWAASAGRSLKRVNELELQLLDLLSWDIRVDEVEFWRVLNEVERWVARETMFRQGFCTYNEAAVLGIDSKILLEILKSLLSIFATLTILYSAFAVSILLAPRLMVCSLHSSNASPSRVTQSKHSPHHFGLLSSQIFDLRRLWMWVDEPATSTFESFNLHPGSFLGKRQRWSFHEKEPLLSQLNHSSALVDTTNFLTCSFM